VSISGLKKALTHQCPWTHTHTHKQLQT
jgi:hypothetical protein